MTGLYYTPPGIIEPAAGTGAFLDAIVGNPPFITKEREPMKLSLRWTVLVILFGVSSYAIGLPASKWQFWLMLGLFNAANVIGYLDGRRETEA